MVQNQIKHAFVQKSEKYGAKDHLNVWGFVMFDECSYCGSWWVVSCPNEWEKDRLEVKLGSEM